MHAASAFFAIQINTTQITSPPFTIQDKTIGSGFVLEKEKGNLSPLQAINPRLLFRTYVCFYYTVGSNDLQVHHIAFHTITDAATLYFSGEKLFECNLKICQKSF